MLTCYYEGVDAWAISLFFFFSRAQAQTHLGSKPSRQSPKEATHRRVSSDTTDSVQCASGQEQLSSSAVGISPYAQDQSRGRAKKECDLAHTQATPHRPHTNALDAELTSSIVEKTFCRAPNAHSSLCGGCSAHEPYTSSRVVCMLSLTW